MGVPHGMDLFDCHRLLRSAVRRSSTWRLSDRLTHPLCAADSWELLRATRTAIPWRGAHFHSCRPPTAYPHTPAAIEVARPRLFVPSCMCPYGSSAECNEPSLAPISDAVNSIHFHHRFPLICSEWRGPWARCVTTAKRPGRPFLSRPIHSFPDKGRSRGFLRKVLSRKPFPSNAPSRLPDLPYPAL